jgi:hypothetical protein
MGSFAVAPDGSGDATGVGDSCGTMALGDCGWAGVTPGVAGRIGGSVVPGGVCGEMR